MQSVDLAYLKTTYLYQPGRIRELSHASSAWDMPIRELLAAGYSFHALQFSGNGYLFRGLRTGVKQIIDNNPGHEPGESETNRVERAMGVYFLSNEISDAISASAMHDKKPDSCGTVLLIRADYFNQQLQYHKAAVLAIGDAGHVFRYPFLTRPISISDIDYVLTTEQPAIPALSEKLGNRIIFVEGEDRYELENDMTMKLEKLGILPACPAASNHYPCQR